MKIGVISDTHIHGGGLAPKQLASRLINKVSTEADGLVELVRPYFTDVELIIHAGDYVTSAVIDALAELAPVEGVAGNMDPHEITSRLPAKTVVSAGGFKIGVVHGWGAPRGLAEKVRREFEAVDCVIFGHSHQSFRSVIGGALVFNPGSPTDQRFAVSRSIGLLHLGKEIRAELIELK
jgi:putative phosphoesterase